VRDVGFIFSKFPESPTADFANHRPLRRFWFEWKNSPPDPVEGSDASLEFESRRRAEQMQDADILVCTLIESSTGVSPVNLKSAAFGRTCMQCSTLDIESKTTPIPPE